LNQTWFDGGIFLMIVHSNFVYCVNYVNSFDFMEIRLFIQICFLILNTTNIYENCTY